MRLLILYITILLVAVGCQTEPTTGRPDNSTPKVVSANTDTTKPANDELPKFMTNSVSSPAMLPNELPLRSKLSWADQQVEWKSWLADMRMAAEADPDPEGWRILRFIKDNATLLNSSKGVVKHISGTKFHIVVIDPVLDADWAQEIHLSRDVFARYDELTSSMIVKKWSLVPRKIRGTIGLHEGEHAYHFRTGATQRLQSPKEQFTEELSAYIPQVRQFRALYNPGYEPFRSGLIKLLDDEMRQRLYRAVSEADILAAKMPDINVIQKFFDEPTVLKKAFGLSGSITEDELGVYLNFAFLDVAFEALDQRFSSPAPLSAKEMKIELLIWLDQNRAR